MAVSRSGRARCPTPTDEQLDQLVAGLRGTDKDLRVLADTLKLNDYPTRALAGLISTRIVCLDGRWIDTELAREMGLKGLNQKPSNN